MSGKNYNLIARLPVLDELGELPQITISEFIELLSENVEAKRLFCVVALADDLRRRVEFLNGNESAKDNFVVLNQVEDLSSCDCLESFFTGNAKKILSKYKAEHSAKSDSLTDIYYRLALAQAKVDGSAFLAKWVGFEVALRNELVRRRAKRLGKDAEKYLRLLDISDERINFEKLELSEELNLLQEDQVIEKVRWEWIVENDSWFSFSDDEVLAYGVKLLALHRWYRLRHASPVASNMFVAPVE